MKRKIPTILLGLVTAGAMLAQTAQPPQSQQPQSQRPQATTPAHSRPRQQAGERQGGMVQRLTARLNLTSAQQSRVRAILKDSREQTKALAPQFRQERMALDNAIKSDSLTRIDQITEANVSVNAEMAANHLKAIAKIYAILTPDQKAKFDQRFDRVMGIRQAKGV
jgi:Spy/CpxP family protein refolding chaperone